MHLLEVKNLTLGITNKKKDLQLIKGIDFSVNEGEIIAIAGESGSGKTLTALSIMNLLPPAIKILNGSIVFNDIRTTEINKLRGKEIAMIFQESRQSLNPLMKIGDQIMETLKLHGQSGGSEYMRKTAIEMLQKLQFEEPEKIMRSWPHQLSGGMCQRVMIAIASINRPKLIIADEPTSSLDAENKSRILSLLGKINREFGTAVIFISHDLSLMQKFCSRILIMQSGKIIEEGSCEKLFSSPLHPYTKELIEAIPGNKSRSPVLPSNKSPLAIQIRELSCSYVNRKGLFGKKEIKPVLHNINIDIKAGEIFGLTGESGCGKTTLARCILGLIDYKGQITTNGSAQMIFQDPAASLNPVKKIGWLLEEPLVIHRSGFAGKSIGNSGLVDEMLIRVGLDPSFKKRRVHELSGGQKQKVCIGRALMLSPKVLIADEAIISLDVIAGAQILNLFKELSKSLGLTIIFISHDIKVLESHCDRTLILLPN